MKWSLLWLLLLLTMARVGNAGLTDNNFTDAFGGGGIDPHWKSTITTLTTQLVGDSATTASSDGKALGVLGSQALLAHGTGDWSDVTVSCWILPSTAVDSMQGIIVAASNGFSFNSADRYFLVSFDRANSFTAMHLYGNGLDVNQPFPGASMAGWLLPGNPHDGKYHKMTLKVVRDNVHPLLTISWDDQVLGQIGVDVYWNLRAPFGSAGIFTYQRAPEDETRFDQFQATWDNAPAPPAALGATFTDPFVGSDFDDRWIVTESDASLTTPTIVSEALAIPSADSRVLDMTGGQAMLARGTETWNNVTVSASILPTGGSDLSIQGVMAGVDSGFNFGPHDPYFSASYLRHDNQSYIRLSLNGGDVSGSFPGPSVPDVVVPGNPLDGQYHTISLKVVRDNVNPLLTAYWDGQVVATFGPDAWWSQRVPGGRVGLYSYYRSATQHTKFDNFTATQNDAGEEHSITWYAPEVIDDLTSRTVASDGHLIPTEKTVLFSYGLGTDTFNQAISWDVGNYTGLHVPTPMIMRQRGVNNSVPGSSAGQVYGTKTGLLVDSTSGTDPDPLADIRGMTLVHNWGDFAKRRPWKYGPNAKLRLQYNFHLGDVQTSGSIQYAQFVVGLVDNVSLKSIWYCAFSWDSRGLLPDGVMMDTGGTPNANIVTHFAPNTPYATLVDGSQTCNGAGSNTWFAIDVTREDLVRALTDINNNLGQNYSLNPDDYSINVVSPSLEEYVPDGQQGMFAAWIDNIYVKTLLPPPSPATVTDPFISGGPRTEWQTAVSTQTIHIDGESLAIPSGDGTVLGVDGIQAVAFTGTEQWGNETVAASILPSTGGGLNMLGVLGGMNANFTAAKSDTYFAATFLYHDGAPYLRLWGNGADVTQNFPGNTLAEVAAPANALDGNYHTIALKVNRDNVSPLVTLLWDGQPAVTFGPDVWWNSRVSGGGVGLMSWVLGSQTNKFDNFNATWDDLDTIQVNAAHNWSIYQ